jgi:hypothetical protein
MPKKLTQWERDHQPELRQLITAMTSARLEVAAAVRVLEPLVAAKREARTRPVQPLGGPAEDV